MKAGSEVGRRGFAGRAGEDRANARIMGCAVAPPTRPRSRAEGCADRRLPSRRSFRATSPPRHFVFTEDEAEARAAGVRALELRFHAGEPLRPGRNEQHGNPLGTQRFPAWPSPPAAPERPAPPRRREAPPRAPPRRPLRAAAACARRPCPSRPPASACRRSARTARRSGRRRRPCPASRARR